MQILAFSGDGSGAGKTTLATLLAGTHVCSFAGALREELCRIYPNYAWWNKSQDYKDNTVVTEVGKSVRQVLLEYGQSRVKGDTEYWARQLGDHLEGLRHIVMGATRVAVDDVRKLIEIDYLKKRFPNVVHFHVCSVRAQAEPFENAALRARADYTIHWGQP